MKTRFTLIAVLVLTLLTNGVWHVSIAKAEIVAKGMVSFWDFDNIEGKTVVDSLGNNSGTIHGNPKVVEGMHGKALEFNVTDDHVIVKDNPSLDITDVITLQTWIKPYAAASTADLRIITKSHTSWGDPWDLYALNMSGHKLRFRIGNGQTGTVDADLQLSLDEWHYVAGTYDGSTLILYQDGEPIKEKAFKGNIKTNNEDFWIGGHPLNPERNFLGIIDEVYIYNRALSEAEVTQNYESKVGIPFAVKPTGKLAFTWGKIKASE